MRPRPCAVGPLDGQFARQREDPRDEHARSPPKLTGDERADLAACLPLEAARILTAQIPDNQPLTGWAFVKDLAARTGASLATTRWDTGSVLAAVAAHAGPRLTTRILHQLPTGWALLFGRAELTPGA
ncbi:DUF2267 domain-containing protein [Streptomyces uncialis]|uniref:DUF2267 domain-containing protein n=1 Tax=Streptomyces uncialis TaxID=1048205 RepID=UPI0037FF6E40